MIATHERDNASPLGSKRVIPNSQLNTAKFRAALQDLGASVVETYPYWSVEGWKQNDRARGGESMPENKGKSAPAQPSETQRRVRQVGARASQSTAE